MNFFHITIFSYVQALLYEDWFRYNFLPLFKYLTATFSTNFLKLQDVLSKSHAHSCFPIKHVSSPPKPKFKCSTV